MSTLAHGQVIAVSGAEEAASIMRGAVESGLRIRCAGINARPRADALVLSSARLSGIAEYEPADLVLGVQSGAALGDIAEITAANNQFLALDPAMHGESSIGAAIATGSAGPLRYGHGTPRDQVLGVEVVAGDGRVLEFGGRVVKNVAGYDLVRLMVGSRGTLGFITRINVRLKPAPLVDRTLAIATASAVEAIAIAAGLHAAHIEAVAMEIVSPPIFASWTLLVRVHGNTDSVADIARRVGEHGNARTHDDARLWEQLRGAESAAAVCVRLANLPSRLSETMAAAERMASEAGIANAACAIHAGDGIVRMLGSELRDPEALDRARSAMRAQGGSLIVERGARAKMFGDFEAATIMQQLKRVFDPAGILGMGSFPL